MLTIFIILFNREKLNGWVIYRRADSIYSLFSIYYIGKGDYMKC